MSTSPPGGNCATRRIGPRAGQAGVCAEMGSPFTARVCTLVADRLGPGTPAADRVIDARHLVVTPGFVNGHMHVSYAHPVRGIFRQELIVIALLAAGLNAAPPRTYGPVPA